MAFPAGEGGGVGAGAGVFPPVLVGGGGVGVDVPPAVPTTELPVAVVTLDVPVKGVDGSSRLQLATNAVAASIAIGRQNRVRVASIGVAKVGFYLFIRSTPGTVERSSPDERIGSDPCLTVYVVRKNNDSTLSRQRERRNGPICRNPDVGSGVQLCSMRDGILAFVGLLVAPPTLAWCDWPRPPREALVDARAVFVGQVVARDLIAEYRYRTTFELDRVYKGDRAQRIEVYDTGWNCDYSFEDGESYLVYAYGELDDRLYTSICSRTKPAWRAALDTSPPGFPGPITSVAAAAIPERLLHSNTDTKLAALSALALYPDAIDGSAEGLRNILTAGTLDGFTVDVLGLQVGPTSSVGSHVARAGKIQRITMPATMHSMNGNAPFRTSRRPMSGTMLLIT